jgi:hypothetical protein
MGLKEELDGFFGTEGYHRLTLGPLLATDGVKYLAEQGKCFWLIDIVASWQGSPVVVKNPRGSIKCAVKEIPFQLWELKKEGEGAVVTMRTDSGEPALVTQKIPWTDFPLDEVQLYLEGGVLLLPSEH